MLNFFKAFVVFLIWAIIAVTTHYFITHTYFNNCNFSINKKEKITPTLKSNFYIIDNTDTIYNSTNGIIIFKNSEKVEMPKKLIDKLSSFIYSNYNKKINISTIYSSKENSTISELRNNSITTIFTANKIAKNRIETSSKLINFKFDKNDSYSNGASINITNRKQSEIDSIESKIVTKRLYLDLVENKIQNTEKLNNYTRLLMQYQKLHPSKTISITGHTDNKGYFQNNLKKGQLKADKLKEYFIENGINSNQIKTYSKGEAKPIAAKYTEEGKKLNNRIEININ